MEYASGELVGETIYIVRNTPNITGNYQLAVDKDRPYMPSADVHPRALVYSGIKRKVDYIGTRITFAFIRPVCAVIKYRPLRSEVIYYEFPLRPHGRYHGIQNRNEKKTRLAKRHKVQNITIWSIICNGM